MADINVQFIIHFWKSFDLPQLQKELDQKASEILDRQNDSDISRRELVALSKQFKRTSPEDTRKIVSPLLKSLQSEIDKLSKRSKAAEAAFLYIYKRIIDIVDPLPVLEHWLNCNSISKTKLDDDLRASHTKNTIQVESHRDSSNLSIHSSKAANEIGLTISCKEEEQNKEINKDNIKPLKRTEEKEEEETEINSAKRVKQKQIANNLLLECSLVGENVQELQSALNQSQSSENLEADCWRNEKLFYAKNSSLENLDDISIRDKMAESEKETAKESNASCYESSGESNAVTNLKKTEKSVELVNDNSRSTPSEAPPNLLSSITTSTSSVCSLSSEERLAAKEREISRLVVDIQRLQSSIVTLKQTTTAQISQLEDIIAEKTKIIKHLEAKIERQNDYEDIKRELNVLRADFGHIGSNATLRDHKPFELYLLEKTKALQSENTALKLANAELTNSLPRHLLPPFLPPFQNLGNVETFGSMLGEEIVNSYAKAYKREIIAAANDQNSSNNATGSPSPPPTSNDDAKSTTSVGTPTSTSAIICNDEPIVNNRTNSPPNIDIGPISTRSPPNPSIGTQYEKLQQQLRINVEKYMNETLNTLNISRCVRELLSVHNIGQRLFAKYVLGLSQGTVSELLSKPKPWDKLTEKGRDSYRKMHAWAADDRCIYFLKSMVPRKGKEATTFKQDDPAAEERIAQILSEAQKAMLSPNKNGSRSSGTPLLNGDAIQIKSEKLSDTVNEATSDNSDRDDRSERRSPASASALTNRYLNSDANIARRVLRKFENDDIPQDMVTRIYQEELAKLIGQQVEDSFRHPHAIGYERTQEEIRQALAIYHQEISRLTQIASSASSPSATNSEIFARFTAASAAAAAAGLVNGANYLGLPAFNDSSLPLDARMRSEKQSNGNVREAVRDSYVSPETDLRHASAFSLVRPKQDNSSGHSKTFSSTPSSTSTAVQNGSILNSGNSGNCIEMNSVEDLSSAASPLQRMQSITNSLLSQSSIPSVPSTPNRPAKAVLPPITQQQFDQYNNLNTEDIVKKVKEQLSQYSISQRLFGESVLGLSQGSVSDLLARPKPWHMLTQKGREPFIRMKMFLEDDNAIHKLVASQYKIAPEKLMRTGSFVAGGTGVTNSPISPVVSSTANTTSPTINSSSSAIAAIKSSSIKVQDLSNVKSLDTCRQSISPGFSDTAGHRSSTSTPEHHTVSSATTAIHSSNIRRLGQSSHSTSNISRSSSSSYPYMQPSVYEMAALTTDLDTQSITTKIKETLMAHNIGQKIFGEVVLGLSQGSVSELLSKPKPWHMLSIKGREPFIRMQLWLNDSHNIEKLQTLKNERREANKRRRTHLEDTINNMKPHDNHIYNFSNNYNSSPNSVSGVASSHISSKSMLNRSYGAPAVKKARILFSEEQKEALRVAFSMDPYPSTTTIEFLANELNLSVRTITNWFHNHRMRLKQISSAGDESSSNNNNNSQINALPYNIGRDSVNFDSNQFRLLLSQRLSDIRLHSGSHTSSPLHRSKYSNMYSTSPVSSHMYANTNSCSSPGSSAQEDDIGTLDLSITSQQHQNFNRHSMSLNDESDADSIVTDGEESVELDLSKTSRNMGSNRRKPQLVSSSSSRRKPAQPQWVDPGLEFSGDEDDDYADDDISDDMMDDDVDDDAYDLVTHRDRDRDRNEIINGVCVRQTDYDIIRNRGTNRMSHFDNTVTIEPKPAFDATRRNSDSQFANNDRNDRNDRHNNIKKLEKSIEEEEEDWEDDDPVSDDVINRSNTGGICDDN